MNLSLSSLLDWKQSGSYEGIVSAPGCACPPAIIVPIWTWPVACWDSISLSSKGYYLLLLLLLEFNMTQEEWIRRQLYDQSRTRWIT